MYKSDAVVWFSSGMHAKEREREREIARGREKREREREREIEAERERERERDRDRQREREREREKYLPHRWRLRADSRCHWCCCTGQDTNQNVSLKK